MQARANRWRQGVCLAMLTAAWASQCVANDDIARTRQQLNDAYQKQLADLSRWCQDQGLAKQAAVTRGWQLPRHSRVRYVYLLPEKAGSLKPPASGPATVKQWHEKFAKLRTGQAEKLLALAKQAIDAGETSLALELANEAARENPDDEQLRRIAGAPDTSVKSRKTRTGWTINTAHFTITTNHSAKAGVQLGRRLELLYDVWWQLFAGYRLTKTQLRDLLHKGVRRPDRRKYKVTYFRTEEDYRAALRGEIPDNVVTSGIYLNSRRSSYFFHNEDEDDGTLFHEVTHQLFSESPRVVREIGRRSDFWIIEGIACYMESLVEHDGYVTLGGADAHRVQDARYYQFKNEFYLLVAELVGLGMQELQRHPQIRRVYAQSAALTHFLMHAQGGRYRDGLVEYLAKVHQGRRASLPAIIGLAAKEIDEQYKQFQQVEDDDLALLPLGQRLTHLTLGGTRVGDPGLAHVKGLKGIQWIDLYKTPVSDAGLAHLDGLPKLLQLDLSATKITNAGLKRLAGMTQLQNLMLGATPITDKGLAHLARLQNLTQLVLWNTNLTDAGLAHLSQLRNLHELDLSGTRITDEGLRHLRGLARLKSLDVSETQVTAAGAADLQRHLPELKVRR